MRSDQLLSITEQDARRLLIQRGFTGDEIDQNFAEYVNKEKDWGLTGMTAEEVAGAGSVEKVRIFFRKDSVKLGLQDAHEGHEDFERYSLQYPVSDRKHLNASGLEPFIARFILSLNGCGIYTVKSCDGWHDRISSAMEKRMSIYFEDRYSALWFRIIMERILGQSRYWYGADIFYAKGGANPDEYRRINRLACFFEQNCGELVMIREKWVKRLIQEFEEKDIKKMLRAGQLESRLAEYTVKDLSPLKEKWRALKEQETVGIQCWDLCGIL